jgi:hypothetical protein
MLEVTCAEYTGGYRIRIEFNNGEAGIVDLSDSLWGPVFEPLRDTETFKRFTLSPVLHTICWDNDADLAPEYLYEKMIEQASTMAGAGPTKR